MRRRHRNNRLIIIFLFIFTFFMITGYSIFNTNISINTKGNLRKNTWNFDYTGSEQTFIVPKTGTYKLETWGAQGGNSYDYSNNLAAQGGFGGYSTGNIKLNKDQKLYLNIGGKGTTANIGVNHNPGGYNGGGESGVFSDIYELDYGSGGGATHISDESGLLSTLSSKVNSILIISGGGGGSGYRKDVKTTIGGSGGGFVGNSPVGNWKPTTITTGGGQTSIGINGSANGFQTSNVKGEFGKGGSNTGAGAGGGSGFYGGGGSYLYAGGGGSGYIGNYNLTDKHMSCYNCETSDEESTKTITNTCSSEDPKEDCSKIGNGYVRITLVK